MSAEYSVEEVRARACWEIHNSGSPLTRGMLTAYADLLERIKADEGAVPDVNRRVGWMLESVDGKGWWDGRAKWDFTLDPNGAVVFPSRSSADFQRLAMFHGEVIVTEHVWITRPPAQAAQEVPEPLRPGYVKCQQCDAQMGGYGYGEFPKLCPVCQNTSLAPTAEPVAQGEAGAVDGDAERAAYEQWFDGEQGKPYDGCWVFGRAAWLARAALAAQPRAVPDVRAMADRLMGWRLPDDFRPDCGISFDPESLKHWPGIWPVGTNLFTADQAEQMFRYVLDAAPSPGESA